MTQAVAALLASTPAASAGAPAPVLTAAIDTALGPTSATIGVSTTVGDGTCSWVGLLTADTTPSFAEVEAGQKSGGAAAEKAGSKTVTGTGAQTFTNPTGLNPSTGYKVAFAHRSSAGVASNVLVADGFTTTALVIGTIEGGGANTTNPTVASGSIAVAVGDAILALASEQLSAPSVTAVTDNLGNTYTAQNAGSANTTNSGRLFYSIATNAGTLTAVNFAAPATANDIALKVAVFGGPFSGIGANPANTTDNTSSYNGPASGVLPAAPALGVGWMTGVTAGDPFTANAPWTMAGAVATGAGAARRAALEYQDVTATTSLTPAFFGAATGGLCVLGTISLTRA